MQVRGRQIVLIGLYKAQLTLMQYTQGLLTGLDLAPEYAIKALSKNRTNRNAAKSAVLKQT